MSETLARNEPHLTLEFLEECIQGYSASTIELKHLCLEYMTPWLPPNLTRFFKHPADDAKRQKVAHILAKLITLSIEEVEMYPSIQANIWGNIGQVSELIDMVLDSFIKRSVTGGLGSAQAEVMAKTSSQFVRSRPVSMRASTHGLVINIIHSLCTCTKPVFSEEALRVLRLSLDEFSLPKFYQLFGISKVHSAATTAFRSAYRAAGERWIAVDRSFSLSNNDKE